jgi:predicted SAM-dependent methyltransferase
MRGILFGDAAIPYPKLNEVLLDCPRELICGGTEMLEALKKAVKASSFANVARPLYRSLPKRFHPIRKVFGNDKRIVRQYLGQHKVKKLQIGCGSNILDGWLNSDYCPGFGRVICLDATNVYPFKNETFDYIFSEHMIEHVSYTAGNKMLKECWRVLRYGGRIRISTPDLAFLISLYSFDKSALQKEYIGHFVKEYVPDAPFDADTFVLNNYVRNWGHTFIYDEKILRFSLENAGFKEVIKCVLNESEDAALRSLENEQRMPKDFLRLESLILEAKK